MWNVYRSCMSVCCCMPTLLCRPRCKLGGMVGVPPSCALLVDLQSVHRFRCCDNIAQTWNVSECLYSLCAWFSDCWVSEYQSVNMRFCRAPLYTVSWRRTVVTDKHNQHVHCWAFFWMCQWEERYRLSWDVEIPVWSSTVCLLIRVFIYHHLVMAPKTPRQRPLQFKRVPNIHLIVYSCWVVEVTGSCVCVCAGVFCVRGQRGIPSGSDVWSSHRRACWRAGRAHQLLSGPRLLRGADCSARSCSWWVPRSVSTSV